MGKIIDKMIDAFGLAEYEEEEYAEVEKKTKSRVAETSQNTQFDYNHFSSQTSNNNNNKNSKIVNIHTNVQMEVVVTNPESFEEATEICQQLKDKKPVVINLEKVEFNTAQRITDFVCGACYALNGNIQRVTNQIYIIAPDNVDFAGDVNIREELATNGILFPRLDD